MPKIVHLSDLHVGYEDCGAQYKRLIDGIIARATPAGEYVVLVTGDSVENANDPDAFGRARAGVDRLTEAGLRVLALPGNHDYGTGDLGNRKFVAIFKEVFFGDRDATYPKLDAVGDVAFIGLDSMAEELHWYDRLFAQGELGAAQLGRLDAMLGDVGVQACRRRVVYLHHHPFDPWPLHELKDSAALGEVLTGRGNVDALLYGHNHRGYVRNGTWGIPRCYDAGSATHKDGRPGYHRVIDLDTQPAADFDGSFIAPPAGPG